MGSSFDLLFLLCNGKVISPTHALLSCELTEYLVSFVWRCPQEMAVGKEKASSESNWWLCFGSVRSLIHVWLFATPWTAGLLSSRRPCPSPTPGVYSTHVHWVGDAIQPSHPLVIPFSSRLQSFLASGSFQMSQFFISGGQSTEVSASASVLPMNIQDWSPLGWTGWILQSKGLSRVFSNTTVQKHQFFSA